MPLTIFGWTRKPKPTPPTVLELAVETEIDVIKDGISERNYWNDRFELVIRPKSIPDVLLRNECGLTECVKLWHWDIGTFWYDYNKKSWIASLSTSTTLYDEEGKFIAAGFNPENNHLATDCALVDGQRLRFYRVIFPNAPFQFYSEVRVRIRCQKQIFLYPVFA